MCNYEPVISLTESTAIQFDRVILTTQLSQSAFEKAAEFIAANARPLERAQFEYHFGSGSLSNVLAELEKFQNDDGGFGHGVEPDLRMPFSSPFAGTIAFQLLRDLEVPGDEPIVRDGIAYFERTYDRSIGGWESVDPRSDEYPHAVWWNYKPVEGQLEPLMRANPGPEIIGYLHLYADQADAGFVAGVTAEILDTFDELPDDMEFHAMMCFMRFAEMASGPVAERLLPKLRRGVHMVTTGKPDDWRDYGGRPLWFAPRPDSLLSSELRDPIQAQLDYEIGTQTDDGSWQPNWSWGQYEDVWEVAKVEWAGYLTLRNLVTLKAWSRV